MASLCREQQNRPVTFVELPIEAPLSDCLDACETNCVAGCCGIEAFDFEPENVSSGSGHGASG
jgi:hypothetical protein